MIEQSEINEDNKYLSYEPQRNFQYMQRYNLIITAIWRGNTDFSPIISVYPVLTYIAKYASKAKTSSTSYTIIISEIVKNLPGNSNCKTLIMEILLSSVGERNYSAQEVMHILMGWPIHKCSRTFVTLSIKDDSWELLQVRFKLFSCICFAYIQFLFIF